MAEGATEQPQHHWPGPGQGAWKTVVLSGSFLIPFGPSSFYFTSRNKCILPVNGSETVNWLLLKMGVCATSDQLG